MSALVVAAPAKLNLDLRIVGRRADGFHELRTVFQSLALHDVVTLRTRRGPFRVRSRSAAVPADERNLVWTAAHVLWEALGRDGRPAGVSVTIRKVIPIGGGLGGGSSNAAAALRGLARLWQAALGRRRLAAVAARVGSDVPYFLNGGTALGTGRGDEIRPIRELRPLWVVLAVPRFGVSSVEAYRWFRERGECRPGVLQRRWRRHLDSLRNDLEPPVVARHPEIAEMVARLRRTGAAHAAMTGSGSTVFGLFERPSAAARARLAARAPGWRTVVTRTTGRDAFRRLCRLREVSSVLPAP